MTKCHFVAASVVLLTGALSSAAACPAQKNLDVSELLKHQYVVAGEVVGIRLTGYLEGRARWGGDYVTDVTPEYEIEVRVKHAFVGSPSELITLLAGGCGVIEPVPRQLGIFAVDESGIGKALYESEAIYPQLHRELLERAGR